MSVLELIDDPSILSVIRKLAVLVRVLPTFVFRVTDGSGIVHGDVVDTELLKM